MAKKTKQKYSMIRTYAAGVFYGVVEKLDRKTRTAVVKNARRVWYWSGAASLSQLATDGTSAPNACKFPTPVDSIELFQVEEIIPLTEKAHKSLDSVQVWKQ